MIQSVKKVFNYFKNYGLSATFVRLNEYRYDKKMYPLFRENNNLTDDMINVQKHEQFEYSPKISIIIPMYKTPLEFFKELVESIQSQTYANWELCLADGTGEEYEITPYINQIVSDNRIKYQMLKVNGGISANTNEALKMATGEFIALVDHDDFIEADALYECVKALNMDETIDSLYSDEDKVDMTGKVYFQHHMKPDFNETYLCSNNYICHMFFTRTEIAREVGGFDSKCDGAQDYDFIFKCTEKSRNIYHIPRILYHWRCHQNSTAGNPQSKLYAYKSGVKALSNHYKRLGISAETSMEKSYGYYRTSNIIPANTKIAIVIIGDDRRINTTNVKNRLGYEFRTVYVEGYDVEKINEAVLTFDEEYVLIIDGSMQVKEGFVISELLGYIIRDNVGSVSTRMYSADKRLMHAGIMLDKECGITYPFRGALKSEKGYYYRIVCPHEVSAVDGRCIMIKKEMFSELGGFDVNLSYIMSVADYCVRISNNGFKNIYNPNAVLMYYGEDITETENIEDIKLFTSRWSSRLEKIDSYFNPNLKMDKLDGKFLIKVNE